MIPPVYVITNDNFLWALSPFSYLFNRYWSPDQGVTVAGYNPPKFDLPNNFRFYSLGPNNAPQNKWSNGLIKFLMDMGSAFGIILLDDYFLKRPVDTDFIELAYDLMLSNPDILRMDLSDDVAHANGDNRYAYYYGYLGHYDIAQKPPSVAYRMSFQVGLWKLKLLLSLLKEDKTPWESEIHIAPPDEMLVLGSLQCPLRYINAVWKGELDIVEIQKLHPDDYQIVSSTFPPNMTKRKV